MTRLTVHEYAAALRHRYRAARKGGKGGILAEFCQTTGLRRKAAIRLLGKATGPVPARRGRHPASGSRWMLASPLLHQSFPQSPRARLRARGSPHLLEDVPDMLVSREERDVQGNRNLAV